MGCCTFVLLLMIAKCYETWTSNPLNEFTTSWDLTDSPNAGPNFGSPHIQNEEKKAGKISTKGPSCPENGDRKQKGKKIKRILGGRTYDPKLRDAEEPDWEHWTASILQLPNRKLIPDQCGGALITKKHVLTALHCLTYFDSPNILHPKDVYIYFDVENAKVHKGTKFRSKKFFYVNKNDGTGKVTYHNNSKKSTKDDIAVIELKEEIKDTDCLHPIKITNKPMVRRFRKKEYWMSGWGVYSLANGIETLSEDLQYIVNKQPNVPCPRKYTDVDKKICFPRTNQHGTCQGDSGSPAVIKQNDEWYLQGIHKGGQRVAGYKTSSCKEDKSIGVDINVFKYKENIEEWIKPYTLEI